MDGCCWYIVFNYLGCFDHPEPVQPVQQSYQVQEPNPFTHTGMPKDAHMLPAYR